MITPFSLSKYATSQAIKPQITHNYIINENDFIESLLDNLSFNQQDINKLESQVLALVNTIRDESKSNSGIDDFLQTYSLDTKEGIILMCLAEALLRIPDNDSIDALIEDKLSNAAWDKHISKSDSLFVNASTWGLMLSGKITGLGKDSKEKPASLLGRMVDKLGEPVIRAAMYQAMKIMGKQFVLGESIKNAIKEGTKNRKKGNTHSFDMLGEAALTTDDAKRYHQNYLNAIETIGNSQYDDNSPRPSISIKLSALHPRYEESQRDLVLKELYRSVITLVDTARALNVPLTIDAEEMDRLELSLDLFEKLYLSESAKNWGQLGLVVQAYSTRALPVLHWINLLATENSTPIPVRLVKGAYWDSEIKLCQQSGLSGYPVFTRKVNTDISYLACANYLLSQAKNNILPQFATHNAQTLSTILFLAKRHNNNLLEFQRLHGMGDELYEAVNLQDTKNGYVRIYAPVGKHKDLLPYLVRRLLENGANTSFVHKLLDPKTPAKQLAEHPVITLKKYPQIRNTKIPKPQDIFKKRKNSDGTNLNIAYQRNYFVDQINQFKYNTYNVASVIDGNLQPTDITEDVISPYNHSQKIGSVGFATTTMINQAIQSAKNSQLAWDRLGTEKRAEKLNNIADLFEKNKYELISLCIREAGKTYQDCIDEVREAVDFCRYYANEAREKWQHPIELTSPTGESNHLLVEGRGIFACISPWNFPLAIFTGQIVAALVTGNAVIAKPAESTNIIAYKAIQLMHQAGIPTSVLQLICGKGADIGKTLIEHPHINGVCFTGSTQTARLINLTLAQKQGPIVPLIAETGGQNAMIVDSTALPEQAVTDIVNSAFMSAGQRCSALRVLFVQSDIADHTLELIKGSMALLTLNNPEYYSTDVSCVIDKTAQSKLNQHINTMIKKHKLIYQTDISHINTENTNFVAPTAIEIESINQLSEEQFGPILHIIRFERKALATIINDINNTGFGLTFGIHTRNESLYEHITDNIHAGNIYINRNQIGAVVGVQPFGGHGLSGTGPKAGGPNYLTRFINEKTISNNITAIGGNASLLAMND